MPKTRKTATNSLSRYKVPILDRTLDLLELLSRHPEGLTLTAMTEALKMPKNSRGSDAVPPMGPQMNGTGNCQRGEATLHVT